MKGVPALRMAVATHLQRTLGASSPAAPPITVDPDHIVVTAGAAAALEGLFFCLGEPGDAVLVPAPFYPAFVGDLGVRRDAFDNACSVLSEAHAPPTS